MTRVAVKMATTHVRPFRSLSLFSMACSTFTCCFEIYPGHF